MNIIISREKNTKTAFLVAINRHQLTLGGQTVVPGQCFWLCGRSVASKLSPQQADEFFYQSKMEIREKRKFFTLRPPARKGREISGWVQWVKQWLRGCFDRVLPAQSWDMLVERELPAKIGRCGTTLSASIFKIELSHGISGISYMTHSQMLGKIEYTLPAKFWRLVGCTEMLSW